jgi:hypothetical protein
LPSHHLPAFKLHTFSKVHFIFTIAQNSQLSTPQAVYLT